MSDSVRMFSVGHEHTAARYFQRAAEKQSGKSVSYWSRCPELLDIEADDLLVHVDPAQDWPVGLESVPCCTAGYFVDVHQDLESRLQRAQFFDAIFVAQRDYLGAFVDNGSVGTHWLPLACDPELHAEVNSDNRQYDVSFVGKLGMPGSKRFETLRSVLPQYRTNDYVRFHAPREMAGIYGNSKIVLNVSINGDLNMRFFEAMASGALLVTDRIENGLAELFEEGRHYVAYSTIEEAKSKIDFYLSRNEERDRIAEEGQMEVLARHTYGHRWARLSLLCQDAIGSALVRQYTRNELSASYCEVFANLRMPWRLGEVVQEYGMSVDAIQAFVAGWGRWVNARVPLTWSAILAARHSK